MCFFELSAGAEMEKFSKKLIKNSVEKLLFLPN